MRITFKNAKLTDLRNTVNNYNIYSVYGAVMALSGEVLGEITFNNSASESINLANVSHSISNVRVVEDMIVGDVTILDTPAGAIVAKNLIRDGELICGYSMTSVVEFNNVIHIVSFNIAPANNPITRNVDFTADFAQQHKAKIAAEIATTFERHKELAQFTGTNRGPKSKKPCGKCETCTCNKDSDDIAESLVYHVIQEPERSVFFVDAPQEQKEFTLSKIDWVEVAQRRESQHNVVYSSSCNKPSETGNSDSSSCDSNRDD